MTEKIGTDFFLLLLIKNFERIIPNKYENFPPSAAGSPCWFRLEKTRLCLLSPHLHKGAKNKSSNDRDEVGGQVGKYSGVFIGVYSEDGA